MTYAVALNAPPRFQWEVNSGTFTASQSNNCGPTCMTFIAGFYRNTGSYAIEQTRRLVMGCCIACDISKQREMLAARGVPAQVYRVTSLTALKSLIGSGRRPISLRINMGRVPSSVRGHDFAGWHAIVLIANGSKNGVSGVWVNDPNFSPPGGTRPDPARGHRFYPDSTLNYAFVAPQPAYAVMPIMAKPAIVSTPVTKYVTFNPNVHVNIRTAPDARKANIYAVADWKSNDIRLGTTSAGKWIGHTNARRTLYAVVSGYDAQGQRVNYNKLRLAGTGRDQYVDSRYMHQV